MDKGHQFPSVVRRDCALPGWHSRRSHPVLNDPEHLRIVPALNVRGGQIHDGRIHTLPHICLTVSIGSVTNGAGLQIDLPALAHGSPRTRADLRARVTW